MRWMMMVAAAVVLAVGLAAGGGGAAAQMTQAPQAKGNGPRDIGTGDPLRKVLLDALRPTVEADIGQEVKFVVETLRVQGTWAYVVARPQTKGGQWIDLSRTHYAEAVQEGGMDGDRIFALLAGSGQGWAVSDYVMGPTDAVFVGWPETFGAPPALFGL